MKLYLENIDETIIAGPAPDNEYNTAPSAPANTDEEEEDNIFLL